MRYTFTGKNMTASDSLKEKTIHKLNRMQKLVPEDAEAFVTFSKTRHQYKVEVSVPMHKRMLRAEVTDNDVNSCLDTVVDVLEKQTIKYKTRLRDRRRRNVATHDELTFISEAPGHGDATEITFHKTKRFALKPMDAQEAVMEMELLGHTFFVFRNGVTDEINVVYKRSDGEYGLIEPQ